MFRFWPMVIKPIFEAAEARTIIEIGAGSGQNSYNICLWAQAKQAHAHIVDPEPGFDVNALAERFGASVTTHLKPSLEVLPDILPADVVLVDGDHNWYTVYNEMRILYGVDADADRLPIAICHDVEWPYGRRDLYYLPERIPAEHRHPYARAPLSPYERGIAEEGINAQLCNAVHEGGEKNGVRTAIEDALADREDDFRIGWIPVLHGLAIIVPRGRLHDRPKLSAVLDDLEISRRMRSLCRVVELERCHGYIAISRSGGR